MHRQTFGKGLLFYCTGSPVSSRESEKQACHRTSSSQFRRMTFPPHRCYIRQGRKVPEGIRGRKAVTLHTLSSLSFPPLAAQGSRFVCVDKLKTSRSCKHHSWLAGREDFRNESLMFCARFKLIQVCPK
ncbi:hypothetical protein CHARACLAT_017043, partial [Characodon lateralis]|nr:hypothetical protein [Characodon lateralis]